MAEISEKKRPGFGMRSVLVPAAFPTLLPPDCPVTTLPERVWHFTVAHSLDGLTIADARSPDAPLVYANPSFIAMTGYSHDDIMGRNCRFLQGADRDQPGVRRMSRAIANEEPCRVVIRNYRKDGSLFWNEVSLYPLFDDEGMLTHYVGSQRDITARMTAQQALHTSEARLVETQRIGRIGSVEWDLQSGSLWFSENMIQLFGLNLVPAVLRPEAYVADWVHPQDRVPIRRTWLQTLAARGEHITLDHRVVRSDGTVLPLHVEGRIFYNGSRTPLSFLGIVQDVTEQVQNQEKLVAAKRDAERMSELKSAFLHNLSHELRTPLNAILGFSELLSQEATPQQNEFLTIVRSSGQRLLRTIEMLLDVALLETGQFDVSPQRVDLASLVHRLSNQFASQAHQAHIELHCSTPSGSVIALVDRRATERILQALLDNAIKFTPKGKVMIELESLPDSVQVRVSDTGIGIDPHFMPELFVQFAQESQAVGRAFEGSGLGLAIAQHLANLQGGSIEVTSQKGQGSSFCLVLPRRGTRAHPNV